MQVIRLLVLGTLVSGVACSENARAGNGILHRIFCGRPKCCTQPCMPRPSCTAQVATPCNVHQAAGGQGVDADASHVEVDGDAANPVDDKGPDFVALAKQLTEAKTVTMSVMPFMSITTKDESKTWIQPMSRSELAFMAPHHYRDTRYARGRVSMVQIVDAKKNQTLMLQVAAKKAMKPAQPINVYDTSEANPLAAVGKMLAEKEPEFVESRDLQDRSIEVYRYIREPRKTSLDLWIDSKTGALFAVSDPGSDHMDLSTRLRAADAPPRREHGKRRMAGMLRRDIQLDPKLDEELFSLEVPEGYELVEAPQLPGGPINPQ